ncbi:methylated-DNA--[protein]-cysteine S-methyltransferase [Vibrio cyclitrophicus]|uniref:Methylated-DNA--protein-cysteine methyltransferase n=3 Tax=Vibrio cyclitrophicus TaxID=47951 RepID=A0A7Z1MF92_9VIBR|nr:MULTISPECIES: methylated-DNA--[protein]-cysteine S-methyltransferase [Vibrio]ERM58507.1 Methylated-DNA--protein-cysteine methyltransferase [Vibrio cyclitrophicus FF75]KAA8602926.1 Methylated-DNA--protein-cysteine methyltransferase [Vibrio cyclitrophicus]MCC4772649.1 methylated-DNA--[protein]-cysteine S-methyltransferase [Vibrio cyclitrophicus]MCC4842990.1 methylated-DNA--[protein]-cysteine S-methyltransferase [Vibrio cyclitrophicus]MDH5879787.1 methylated-DNA--[protein]-cysteine S-methyltra|tara:strand:+ start:3044 stop:3526 length:483 start_codon:yes stop_codon:yes gene_type:complete
MANRFTYYESPLGTVTLQGNDEGLLGLWFETYTTKPDQLGVRDDDFPIFELVADQLNRYFSGEAIQFTVPISAKGTPFQQSVWQALTTIPYGETWSYAQLADAIGNPKAVRAVGLANGKNPVSVIVPCHRVIGKNGKLTGYAGGVERKQRLLVIEGREQE